MLHLDDHATRPRCFSGEIRTELQQCEKLPVIQFEIISTFPTITDENLSLDHKDLFDMTAISTGTISSDWANKAPRSQNKCRWLTTANKTLRLYAAKIDPGEKLKKLWQLFLVYGRMWFEIKCNSSSTKEAKHLWSIIYYSVILAMRVIDPVVQITEYYGHPETL